MEDEVAQFENGKTIEQRIDEIGQELLANAFLIMDSLRAGNQVSESLQIRQDEMQKQLKFLKNTYMDMVKMGRINTKPNENFDKQFLNKIKEQKGTIGNIIADIPKDKKDEKDDKKDEDQK